MSKIEMNRIEELMSREEDLEMVAYVLKTIGHPVRLKIIALLSAHKSMTVNEICDKCNVEQSLISHHLNNMKLKGILKSKRDGKNIYYSILLIEVLNVIDCMSNCKMG
ncbi:MAG: metalloregulator ArsR/SmtB family transcription factor [Reichenbachiella sp.]